MLYIILFLALWLGLDTFYKWLPAHALKRIDVSRQFLPERIVSGERSQLVTTISNRKWLPLPWIRFRTVVPWQFQFDSAKTVQLRRDESCMHTVTSSLLFYEKLMRKDAFVVAKRGFYKLDALTFETGDVFGWVEAETTFSTPIKLWVHPEIKPLFSLIKDTKSLMGEISVRRWIVPDPMFAVGARDYTDKDPMSAIDWKATARVNRLQVKKQDYTADKTVQIFLDTQSAATYWRHLRHEVVEHGISVTASVVEEALLAKIPVGLLVNNLAQDGRRVMQVSPGLGAHHRTVLMDTLATASAYRTEDMATVMQAVCRNLAEHTLIVIVTAFLSGSLAETLNRLAKRGFAIKLVDLSGDHVPKFMLHRSIERFESRETLDETLTEYEGSPTQEVIDDKPSH